MSTAPGRMKALIIITNYLFVKCVVGRFGTPHCLLASNPSSRIDFVGGCRHLDSEASGRISSPVGVDLARTRYRRAKSLRAQLNSLPFVLQKRTRTVPPDVDTGERRLNHYARQTPEERGGINVYLSPTHTRFAELTPVPITCGYRQRPIQRLYLGGGHYHCGRGPPGQGYQNHADARSARPERARRGAPCARSAVPGRPPRRQCLAGLGC